MINLAMEIDNDQEARDELCKSLSVFTTQTADISGSLTSRNVKQIIPAYVSGLVGNLIRGRDLCLISVKDLPDLANMGHLWRKNCLQW